VTSLCLCIPICPGDMTSSSQHLARAWQVADVTILGYSVIIFIFKNVLITAWQWTLAKLFFLSGPQFPHLQNDFVLMASHSSVSRIPDSRPRARNGGSRRPMGVQGVPQKPRAPWKPFSFLGIGFPVPRGQVTP
jgi:hypothetical protein